jgi:hypothetical protein
MRHAPDRLRPVHSKITRLFHIGERGTLHAPRIGVRVWLAVTALLVLSATSSLRGGKQSLVEAAAAAAKARAEASAAGRDWHPIYVGAGGAPVASLEVAAESAAAADTIPRDTNGRIQRSEAMKHAFEVHTNYPQGRAGYVVDHIQPLACGGADDPSNMQWQTIEAAKAKDKVERLRCASGRPADIVKQAESGLPEAQRSSVIAAPASQTAETAYWSEIGKRVFQYMAQKAGDQFTQRLKDGFVTWLGGSPDVLRQYEDGDDRRREAIVDQYLAESRYHAVCEPWRIERCN